MRTLLIVSGGLEAVPGIRLAKDMGLYVVVSDMNLNAPGFAVADDHIIASTYDVEATVAAAQEYHRTVRPIDGVMCIASDVPLTVASVAAALDLPGIPVDVARLAMDKLAMKRKFAADAVPIPWFNSVESVDHLRQIAAKHGYPLVLKPVDSRGSRGVLRLTADVNLKWAYHLSLSYSPTGRVMVEQFLAGPQVSTESIMLDGVAYTPGFSDRNYEYLERYAPHIIENGGDLPSHLPEETQQAVRDLIQQAAISMGIQDGVVKGDIVVHDGKPYVIELAARLSGGYFCTHEIPLNTGVDMIRAVIQLSLGEHVEPDGLQPKFNRCVSQRWLFPRPGRVVSITGVDQARQVHGVAEVIIEVQPGDIINSPSDSNAAAGTVIAAADTRDEALARVAEAMNSITVGTEPL